MQQAEGNCEGAGQTDTQTTDAMRIIKTLHRKAGPSRANRWRLIPSRHAVELPAEADVLGIILTQPDVQRSIEAFEMHDAAAGLWQSRYKRLAYPAIFAVFIATLAGAAFLLPIDHLLHDRLKLALSAIQYLSFAIAGALWIRLAWPRRLKFQSKHQQATQTDLDRGSSAGQQPTSDAKPATPADGDAAVDGPAPRRRTAFQHWHEQRALAEAHRLALFRKITGATPDATDGPFKPPVLQLEYFVTFLHEAQMDYYQGRGNEHKSDAEINWRWTFIQGILTCLAAVIGAGASAVALSRLGVTLPESVTPFVTTLEAGLPPWIDAGLLAVGLIGSAFFTVGASLSTIRNDARNATRYRQAHINLKHLHDSQLPKVREAVLQGRSEEMKRLVDQVHEQLFLEHREWLDLRSASMPPEEQFFYFGQHFKGMSQ